MDKFSSSAITILLMPLWPHTLDFIDSFQHCRLQDISSGYWVLVLHFTRREAVRQIDELQHIATNLGRSETPLLFTYVYSTWGVKHQSSVTQSVGYMSRKDLFSLLCRSCMVIPGTEWELFRELPAPLPGEPRITTEVLFQVSHPVILILERKDSPSFRLM